MVLDPDLLWLNSPERGIFIDPLEAVAALRAASVAAEAVCLAATDVWDSSTGMERRGPGSFWFPPNQYIRPAAKRPAPESAARRAGGAPARAGPGPPLLDHFHTPIAGHPPPAPRPPNTH